MVEQMIITEANKYSTKDIAKWIRQQFKKTMFNDLKFSVRYQSYSGGSSISIVVLESKNVRFIKTFDEIEESDITSVMAGRNDTREQAITFIKSQLDRNHYDINQYHFDSDWGLTSKGKDLMRSILYIANKYNYDNSDSMTDYFDVNYYLDISLGSYDKPFKDGCENK